MQYEDPKFHGPNEYSHLEVVFHLPDHPLVKREVLEQEYPVTVGGVAGVLGTPVPPPLGDDGRAPYTAPALFHVSLPDDSFEQHWGTTYYAAEGDAFVTGVAFRFDLDATIGNEYSSSSRVANRVATAMSGWFGLACRWMSVQTGQDLLPENPLPLSVSASERKCGRSVRRRRRVGGSTTSTIRCTWRTERL